METLSSVCWRYVHGPSPLSLANLHIRTVDRCLNTLPEPGIACWPTEAKFGLFSADTSHLITHCGWIPLQPASIQDWCEPSP